MESLSYLHLELAIQEPLPKTQETVGSSWNSETWKEIFEEVKEEEDETTD